MSIAKNEKKLLVLNINEINFQYLKKGAKKFNCKNINFFFKDKKKIKTLSKDKIQDKNLDPWVQSVSISLGKSSNYHKIFKSGQTIKKAENQIWDILASKKITCSVWGPMNSLYKPNKNLKLYFPDPWNHKAVAHPKSLNYFLNLAKYYGANYTDFYNFKFITILLITIRKLFFSKILLYFLSNFILFTKIFFNHKLRNYILFFIFDLISFLKFESLIKKNNSKFCMIFLNSFAHFQHNNWNDKNDKIFFLFAEKIFKRINYLASFYDDTILFNSFTQKKIKTEYSLRPQNPYLFLRSLGLKIKNLDQNMTNGGILTFKKKDDLLSAYKLLSDFKFLEFKFFYVEQLSQNKLFYKIILRSKVKKKLIKLQNLNKKDILRYFKCNTNINKKNLKDRKYTIDEKFWNEIIFIKTSGVHIPKGEFFYTSNNIKIRKKQIPNHNIFKILKNYFF